MRRDQQKHLLPVVDTRRKVARQLVIDTARSRGGAAAGPTRGERRHVNLQELIAMARGDRSYGQLAAADPDSPKRQRWQQLAAGTLAGFPDPGTIRAVARVLRLSERRVVLACAESVGLDVDQPGQRLIGLLPPDVDRLTDEQINVVRMVIDSMVHGSDHRAGS